MSHIGFTGTQEGMTWLQERTLTGILKIIRKLKDEDLYFHHGDCIGSDVEAHNIAVTVGFITILHPPTVNVKRAFCNANQERVAKSYLVRNKDIVDESAYLIATPNSTIEELRSGTWSTIRYARKQSKRCLIIFPDGTKQFKGAH